jgi:hypothetical protein
MTFFYSDNTADSGTNIYAYTRGICFRHFQSGVIHGLLAGGYPIMDEDIHFFDFLGGDEITGVKIFNRTADARGKSTDIKIRNGGYAAFTGQYILPGFFDSKTYGAYHTQSGDNHASFAQKESSLLSIKTV